MGQVPAIRPITFGIVGDGRLARHFRHYLDLLGLPWRAWSRQQPQPSPPEALAGCAVILVLTSDSAIVPFIESWPALRRKRLVHCSGSLVTPSAECAHPLMTFGPRLYDLAAYRAIPFALDRGGASLAELLPGLPNPSFTIPAAERPYYHALCVMAGNFSTLLWRKLFEELERRFEVPSSVAHPFLDRVASNLLADPGQALTGPLARGDAAALVANLRALEGDRYHDVYAAFVRAHGDRS